MNTLIKLIKKILKYAAMAFQSYPATIICALAFAAVTCIRIQLDWSFQEPYNFLFNCLHWSFALGAIFSLMAITAAQSRFNTKKVFLIANLLGFLVVIITFLALYLFGARNPDLTGSAYPVLANIAAVRVSMAIAVSFLLFIVLTAHPKDLTDFSQAFFVTHRAFFAALVIGIVIMAGASGVAGAFQGLIYNQMSEKVYMYIGTIAGFMTFTIFIGYFPDFRKGITDLRRTTIQKQPRFVEILLTNIIVPIFLALTVVLLIWAFKTILTGVGASFIQLSSIAATYAIGGIWLYVLVTHHEFTLAKFYRRVYPIAALVILAFEAWALFSQLEKTGLKVAEYSFSLVWILAVTAAILLLTFKFKAYIKIITIICILAVFSVLPLVGYHALPVTAQVNRLESLLISQDMLQGENLMPAKTEPELTVRVAITDAVSFLANAQDAKLPEWFDKRLGESEVFKSKFGFEQTWEKTEPTPGNGEYLGTSLTLPPEAINISDYRWAVSLQQEYTKGQDYVTIDGDNGVYHIYWIINPDSTIPVLKVTMDDHIILEKDMRDYIDQITAKYPPGQSQPYQATLGDMSLHLETPEISIMLVFSTIDINLDTRADKINYWLNLIALYLKENKINS